jgi:hypothetical protein
METSAFTRALDVASAYRIQQVGIIRTVVAELVPQKKAYIRVELFMPEREIS